MINLGWLDVTDSVSGLTRRETAQERKNRIARERRAVSKTQLAQTPDKPTATATATVPAPAPAPKATKEPKAPKAPPAPKPEKPKLPRFAWKRPGSMGFVLHAMLLKGCTRAEIAAVVAQADGPFTEGVYGLLDGIYRTGRWNKGAHLMDGEFEGGIKERWTLTCTGEKEKPEERYLLTVERSKLTDEDRKVLIGATSRGPIAQS